eukprot:GHVU01177800.1.p1 GENE.GHVU01177800.1~~GHVU01177800.1.p1  ORF type:complete len:119 (-),score=10.02 GHVU01177800.1:378-734(-)
MDRRASGSTDATRRDQRGRKLESDRAAATAGYRYRWYSPPAWVRDATPLLLAEKGCRHLPPTCLPVCAARRRHLTVALQRRLCAITGAQAGMQARIRNPIQRRRRDGGDVDPTSTSIK